MESLFSDIRFGARMLWKSKGVSAVAVLSLAVGIGANAVIFSLVKSILMEPRPVAQPSELVALYTGDRGQPYQSSSYPTYLELRRHRDLFRGLAAFGIQQYKIGGGSDGEVEQVWGEAVSGNYFEVLGVQPSRGRAFLAEEDSVINRNPVVIISHGLWQRRYASDPDFVGRTVRLNNQPLTVVGIAPPKFHGMMGGLSSDFWVPAMIVPMLDLPSGHSMVTSTGSSWLTLIGRLQPTATIDQVQARLDVFSKAKQEENPHQWLRSEYGPEKKQFMSVLPESQTRVHPGMRDGAYAAAALLFASVDLVLLIACMNLAGVLFARAVARRQEIAVRLALGAGRARIVRQLLTESVLLAGVAGAAGAVLAVWVINLLMASIPALPLGIRFAIDLTFDWRVVVYTAAFTTAAGLLFGLAPALHSSKAAVATVLKDDAGTASGRFRKSGVRATLVVAQVALSLVLLIGAGFVLQSLGNIRPTRLGFASANYVVAPIELDENGFDRRRAQDFYERLSERVAALPGVETVSMTDGSPGGFLGFSRSGTEIEGYTPGPGERLEIQSSIVGPNYFTNMKVPVVSGRDFRVTDREGAPCVSIINEAFARRYLPNGALGKHLSKGEGSRAVKCAIVGVVRDDAWQSLQKTPRPEFTFAALQSASRRMTLLASTSGAPESMVAAVRATVRQLDPSLPLADVQTLDQHYASALFPFRLLAIAIGACGALALLLATVGIYGVIAYSVAQRGRELGIRMALGALHTDILKLVVRQGMTLVTYGLGIGLVLAAGAMAVLVSLPLGVDILFGVSATDITTFGGVSLILALVALVACWIPARRAAKVDPMVSLRNASRA